MSDLTPSFVNPSDIDFVIGGSVFDDFEGKLEGLPEGRIQIERGLPSSFEGPFIRFEPGESPRFTPGEE